MNKPGKKARRFIRLLWIAVVFGIFSVGITMYGVTEEWFGKLPTFDELENPRSNLASIVYTSDQQILGKYYRENRTNATYDRLSQNVVNALIATEDARFREHAGIDLKATARAVVKRGILQQESSGGGSTITQQLAKMLFHDRPAGTIERMTQKLKEWIIAVRLEKRYTKNEILTMYLNKFDFINQAVGIHSAAEVYFDTTPDSLKIEQAAMLVGMAKNPSLFNPLRRPDTTLHRREVVLKQMQTYGYLTQAEYDSLRVLELGIKYKKVDHNLGMAPYFRERLRLELQELLKEKDPVTGEYLIKKPDGKPYNIYSDGLRIYTSLNSKMQRLGEEALKKHIGKELQEDFDNHIDERKNWPFGWRMSEKEVNGVMERAMRRSERYNRMRRTGVSVDSIRRNFKKPVRMSIFSWNGEIDTIMTPMDSIRWYKHFLQSGMMSMDPNTGYIKAWVGGMDYTHFKYDHVKQGARQVGSTFKPFVYATAINEKGFSPCMEIPNVRMEIPLPEGKMWSPKNADGKYGNVMTMKEGLATSTNCIAAYLMREMGTENRAGPTQVITLARSMGVYSPIDTVPSIALGTCDITLYEMVGAFSTFVNHGVCTKPQYLIRIEDKNGNVIRAFEPETNHALKEETAYIMVQMMKGVTQRVGEYLGTAIRLRGSARPYGGHRNPIAAKTGTTSNQSDGWFIGMTPDLVTGVWTGCEDRGVHFNSLRLGMGSNLALPIWGYYMNDVWADSTLNISSGDFEKPDFDPRIELNCDKFRRTTGGLDDELE